MNIRKLPRIVLVSSGLLAGLLATSAYAQSNERLFSTANPAAGKALHAEHHCAACHQQRSEKNEAAFYTRAERKIASQEKLIAQVAACSAQLNLGLFPEDEVNIAAFLNRDYYKLK